MTTNDITPEAKKILQTMFENGEGKMTTEGMEELLNLPSQETLYHRGILIEEKLITEPAVWASGMPYFYHLTHEGRTYYMNNLHDT